MPTRKEISDWKAAQLDNCKWHEKKYFSCLVAIFIGLSLCYWSGVIVWILTKFSYREMPDRTGKAIIMIAAMMAATGVVAIVIADVTLDDMAAKTIWKSRKVKRETNKQRRERRRNSKLYNRAKR